MVTPVSGRDEVAGERLGRVRSLSDEQLLYYFDLLTDEAIVRNAPPLDLIRAEIRSRGLSVPGSSAGK